MVPLRVSLNHTLGRTVATSLTVILSILPLALIGDGVMRGFGLAIIFGIVSGTSSSSFIASPILLFLGEKQLRPSQTRSPNPNENPAGSAGIGVLAVRGRVGCGPTARLPSRQASPGPASLDADVRHRF